MVRVVIIIVVILVLLGGGAFGVAHLMPGVLPPAISTLLGVPPSEEAEHDDVPEVHPQDTTLVNVEPITIPLFTDGEVDRFLIIHLYLEVRTGPDVGRVNQLMTRIVDVIITHTLALAALDIDPGIKDRNFLKERLQEKIDQTVGDDLVVDILFQNLFERPLG
ncbi:MAG: flagellar basal body-associated FliL family protein [Alphaproteobacteria bacterium]|jgi:flagellar basal body-associated protein FliL|nr:flagellar basal body-associated FliL family protein [Alphaproteobacteria bacterium]